MTMISIAHLSHGSAFQNPKRIVIHAMAEFVLGEKPMHAVTFLDHIGYSAHSLIASDGTNFRCRNDMEGAFHAKGFNTDSLGLEFLVDGAHDYDSFIKAISIPYVSDEQYAEGVRQVVEWKELYSITRIDRHSDLSPHIKKDPGKGFPWQDFLHDTGFA